MVRSHPSILLSVFVCLTGCAQNYVSKQKEFHLISEKTEISIGRKAKEDIVKEYGSYKDFDWQVYLDEVGQRVARCSDRPNLQYDFTIIDTDELNAFAVPGGFVFVTRGILEQIADEAELSIVLGHEITHIAGWHGIEMLQRAGLLSTLTALGTIGGIAMGAGGAAVAIAQAAGVYENLYLVGYGRTRELEADKHGIAYASRAGYDPGAAITFFQRLDKIEKEEEAGQNISPYWRSHPPTADRLRIAKQWVALAEVNNTTLMYNRDKYQSMVARLPHGTPTERGTIQGNHYTNTDYGVSLDVPQGWTLDNTRVTGLVGFTGPVPIVRGDLIRNRLPENMTVQDYAKQFGRQNGIHDVIARDVDYPAGHGLLWEYGGDYTRFRTLLIVRNGIGYSLICQLPSDDYLQYVIDCERVMRSLQIQSDL